jgi:hypothetical protein
VTYKAEQTLRNEFARHQQQAAAKASAEVAKARADAAAQVEKARKEVTKAAVAALQPKITEAVAQAVQAERAKAYGEKLAMEQQLEEMKRKLQRKSAHDIGEPAEVDLHEMLTSAFPEDVVSRVVKGVRGPDVIIEVIYEGNTAGKIIRQQGSSSLVKQVHTEIACRSTVRRCRLCNPVNDYFPGTERTSACSG